MDKLASSIPQSSPVLPFGLYFRQILPLRSPLSLLDTEESTSEPEISTQDGNNPDKIEAVWIPDEDEPDNDDDDEDDE